MGIEQAESVKSGSFIGKGRSDGNGALTQQERQSIAEIVSAVIYIQEIVGERKMTAGLGRDEAVIKFGGKAGICHVGYPFLQALCLSEHSKVNPAIGR